MKLKIIYGLIFTLIPSFLCGQDARFIEAKASPIKTLVCQSVYLYNFTNQIQKLGKLNLLQKFKFNPIEFNLINNNYLVYQYYYKFDGFDVFLVKEIADTPENKMIIGINQTGDIKLFNVFENTSDSVITIENNCEIEIIKMCESILDLYFLQKPDQTEFKNQNVSKVDETLYTVKIESISSETIAYRTEIIKRNWVIKYYKDVGKFAVISVY